MTTAVRDPHMMTGQQPFGQRVSPRRLVAVPLSVTILRSGVPDSVPGRSVDLGEGGLGAVLAAELFPGELVGVEFRLPDAGSILTKARVCYQERLRCGLQFLAVPAEQRAILGSWTLGQPRRNGTSSRFQPGTTSRIESTATSAVHQQAQPHPAAPKFAAQSPSDPATGTPKYIRRKILMLLAASIIAAAGVGWWQWEQAWQELESHSSARTVEVSQPPVAVPADVMQHLLVHRVDPMLPGRPRVAGLAVLAARIGRDGSVSSLRPVSGPDVLTRAAMDAVQWWKFEPYRLDGEPVDVETTVAVEFR
jgi:hypothetical protein